MIHNLALSGISACFGQRLMQAAPEDMVRCEEMYASQWRTEPFVASTLEAEELEVFESNLRFEIACKQVGEAPSSVEDEWAMELWYERVGMLAASLPPAVGRETQLVFLVNYKGEGEGLAVFSQVSHLPVFVSRTRSEELFS